MTENTYTYSLLQYRHSQILEEVLNVGVLVYFHQEQKLFFLHPEKLARLRFAYLDFPERTVKSYCKAFEAKALELTKQNSVFKEYDIANHFHSFVNHEFLPEDSSTLQFSNPKTGIIIDSDFQRINDRLYNLYFTVFDQHNEINKRIDELQLITRYKHLLKELQGNVFDIYREKIKLDYIIRPSSENELKFDIAWQNGSLNLVKAISFDVKRKETLQRKAYLNFGQFSAIENFASIHNYNFDLILAKPKNPDLFKAYDEAIKLLERPRYVNLIESADLETYTKKTIIAISKN
jgi:hypothetical protein